MVTDVWLLKNVRDRCELPANAVFPPGFLPCNLKCEYKTGHGQQRDCAGQSSLKRRFHALLSFTSSSARNCREVLCAGPFFSIRYLFLCFLSLSLSFPLSPLFRQWKVKKNNVILVSKGVCVLKNDDRNGCKVLFILPKLGSRFMMHKYVQFSNKLCTISLFEENLLNVTCKRFTECNLKSFIH